MNYLVHLFLSDNTPGCLLGSLMGDFVKGRLDESHPPEVRWGIELHRKVDLFAHENDAFRRSKRRLDDSFGHCRAIMVDIFYDHFLARNWHRYSPTPLEAFAQEVYRLLEEHCDRLPAGLREVAPRMIAHNWLVSYREVETIGRVLERISARLKRPNPMAGGIGELRRNYAGLEGDCHLFLAQALDHVETLRTSRV